MIFVDATALRVWLDCRESYRITQVENWKPSKTAIHREWGIQIHEALERAWRGESFDDNLTQLMESLNLVELVGVTPPERTKWETMVGYTPDVLACYYDTVETDIARVHHIDSVPLLEYEWTAPEPFGITGITVCGRMDRVEVGPVLVDTKTASEVGRTWKADFKAEKLRDIGLALYDWYLCSIGHTPVNVVIEAVIKPYKDKACRVQRIDLPEMMAYRKRFAEQLKWNLNEIKHYWASYTGCKPWPMNTNASCHGRFGPCEFVNICNGTKKVNLVPRVEHLECRKTQ